MTASEARKETDKYIRSNAHLEFIYSQITEAIKKQKYQCDINGLYKTEFILNKLKQDGYEIDDYGKCFVIKW